MEGSRSSKEIGGAERDGEPRRGSYEFYILGQQQLQGKPKATNRRLHVTEVSTVTISARYSDGRRVLEVVIPRVPAFLYNCASTLNKCEGMSAEIFRKPGSKLRMDKFHRRHEDMYVSGCSFDGSDLIDLDVASLFKYFLRDRLEVLLPEGDAILNEIVELLGDDESNGVEFDVDNSPESGVLLFVIKFLHSLCLNDSTSRLTSKNLAIYFTPTIVQNAKDKAWKAPQDVNKNIDLVQKLIENSHRLRVKEPQMKRVRSTSISMERTDTSSGGKRSSSVFGRLMRGYIGNRKRIYSCKIQTVQLRQSTGCSPAHSSPETRLSRSTTRTARRSDATESVEKVARRTSLKEMRIGMGDSPLSSSLSPDAFSRNSMLMTLNFDENRRREQLIDSSLTTLPPSNDTFGAYGIRLQTELFSPELDTSFGGKISPKPISLGEMFGQQSSQPSTAVIYTSPTGEDFEFKRPDLPVPRSKSCRPEKKTPSPTYTSLITIPPEKINKKDSVDSDAVAATHIDLPVPRPRRRESSTMGFGNDDMANLIRSSADNDILGGATNTAPSNRPSIALLNEKKKVKEALAKLERHSSSDSPSNTLKPSKKTNAPSISNVSAGFSSPRMTTRTPEGRRRTPHKKLN